ncbi:MAG: hypothetical protein RI100_07210 [Nitrosarchaeum sp.]|jgi:hypothetical protein|uniref:hypothetical protein n=1 Tax=Nitrosarchaeum sp. TaxID=2026886 RepID=UPI002DF351DB|nr:hypothetical protein [Nitrosarchaeum sp.]
MKKFYFVLIFIFLLLSPNQIYGISEINNEKNILITKSNSMKEINFDGKWTFQSEWKQTSWNPITSGENTVFHLRTAHQEDFIYILIDVISDTNADVGSDKATVCIDSKNNKSEFFDDDYCFIVHLEERNFIDTLLNKQNNFVIQGDTQSKKIEELEKIKVKDFVGVGTMSDKEDKYSGISHASYEFKIPIELIGRSDIYGFYVNVFDANSNVVYSWPEDIKLENFDIPSSSLWGNLISPDKSLLENSVNESIDSFIILLVIVISASIFFIIFKKRLLKRVK